MEISAAARSQQQPVHAMLGLFAVLKDRIEVRLGRRSDPIGSAGSSLHPIGEQTGGGCCF
jgi:hypothetical protein